MTDRNSGYPYNIVTDDISTMNETEMEKDSTQQSSSSHDSNTLNQAISDSSHDHADCQSQSLNSLADESQPILAEHSTSPRDVGSPDDSVKNNVEVTYELNSPASLVDEDDGSIGEKGTGWKSLQNTGKSNHDPALRNEGVFANLSAKPENGNTKRNSGSSELPPPYATVAEDRAPSYSEPITINISGANPTSVALASDASEFLEGMEVGKPFTFLVTFIISFVFQLVGFFACSILSHTHAGKLGARGGFGLSLMQFGMIIQSDRHVGSGGTSLFSFLFMIMGWFLTMQAITEYIRVRRFQQALGSLEREVGNTTMPPDEDDSSD